MSNEAALMRGLSASQCPEEPLKGANVPPEKDPVLLGEAKPHQMVHQGKPFSWLSRDKKGPGLSYRKVTIFT